MKTRDKILDVVKTDFPVITFITVSGNYRTLNIRDHFDSLGIIDSDFGYEILKDKNLFSRVTVKDNALAWEELRKNINLPDGHIFSAYFHLDLMECINKSDRIVKPVSMG